MVPTFTRGSGGDFLPAGGWHRREDPYTELPLLPWAGAVW